MKKRTRKQPAQTVRPIDRQALEHVSGGGNDNEYKYVPIRRFIV